MDDLKVSENISLVYHLAMDKSVGTPLNFEYAHFTIPLYKYPLASIGIVQLPVLILNLITIGIFLSEP